jgi:hypothetical protein
MAAKASHKAYHLNQCSECGKMLKFSGKAENPLICWTCAILEKTAANDGR